MIGNDIVDLDFAKNTSNWKRFGFLEKIFTKSEQLIISESSDKDRMVWRLWSMKEAAYKVYVRQYKSPFFNPNQLICKVFSSEKGLVSIRRNLFYTHSDLADDFVHSVGRPIAGKSDIQKDVFSVESQDHKPQSQEVRQKLRKALSETNLVEFMTDDFRFGKDDFGIPHLYRGSENMNIPFSLSHHGRFGGYAIS